MTFMLTVGSYNFGADLMAPCACDMNSNASIHFDSTRYLLTAVCYPRNLIDHSDAIGFIAGPDSPRVTNAALGDADNINRHSHYRVDHRRAFGTALINRQRNFSDSVTLAKA